MHKSRCRGIEFEISERFPGREPCRISLDCKVGKVPVTFPVDGLGKSFCEMRQLPPQFGSLHDKGDRRALARSDQ